MQDCYKSVANEMVVNDGDVPVYEVVVKFQHTELGVLIDEEADVVGQVVGHACLARRNLVRVVGDNVQLAESFVADQQRQRRADFGTVLNIAVSIDVGHRLAVRRISKKFHRIGYYCFVGVGVSGASSSGHGISEILEARLRFVLDDLVDTINDEPVRKVPL